MRYWRHSGNGGSAYRGTEPRPGRDRTGLRIGRRHGSPVFAVLLGVAVAATLLVLPGSAYSLPPGPWVLPPSNLSAPGPNTLTPQVTVGPDGTTTVIWPRDNGSDIIAQAVTRPPGGSFGVPVDLSAAGQGAIDPQVVAGPDGTTTVTWRRYNGSNFITQAVTRPPGGSFGAPVDLSAPGNNAYDPQIAVAPDGTTTVTWRRYNGSNYIVQAVTRPPGGSFGAPVDLSATGQDAYDPQVSVAPDGTTTVTWRRYNGSNYIVQAVTRPPGGSFGVPADLSAAGGHAYGPQVAAGPDGTTTVIWRRYNGSNFITQAVTRPAGGSFGAPVDLSAPGNNAYDPQIAVAPDGTTIAVWRRWDSSHWIVQAAARPPGGNFGAPIDLSAAGKDAYSPQVAFAPDGTGIITAVWARSDGSNNIVQSASTAVPSLLLGVSKTGSGQGSISANTGGINCGTSCAVNLPAYTKVTLTATPDPGSTFTGWSGDCSGTGMTCQVTMNAARTATATFDRIPAPPRPTNGTAVFDGQRLHVRLKCGSQYRPECVMSAAPVTGKGSKGKPMAKPLKRTVRAGKWVKVTFVIKPAYRARVMAMTHKTSKQLYVQQKIRSRKIGKKWFKGKKPKIVWHRYRVRSSV